MRVVSCLLVLLLAGCATAPADEEPTIANGAEVARAVVLCHTTLADLQAQLGAPSRDGIMGRSRVMTWIVTWDPLTKYLGVMADENGVVVDVYWDLPSEVTWSPANRCK